MKKKSDILTAFRNFVAMLERHYNIQVFILYDKFSKCNSDAAAEYLSHIDIDWEQSRSNTQQQNDVGEYANCYQRSSNSYSQCQSFH